MSEELAILELLVREASTDQIEAIVAETRRNGASGARLEKLERARQLGLMVRAQADRRQQREASMSALLDTARDLVGLRDLDMLLNATIRRARLLLRADMAYVSLPDEAHGEVYVRAAEGHTSTHILGVRLPAIGGMGRAILTDTAPFWTPDYVADERFPHSDHLDEVVRTEGLHGILAAPLAGGDQPFGVLYVANRSVRHFTVDEISLLSAFSGLAGVLIASAMADERVTAEAAVLRRRTAIAESGRNRLAELSEINRQLIDLVLSGGDLQALAEDASKLLDGPAVALCGWDGSILAKAGDLPGGDGTMMLRATMDAHAAGKPVPLDDGGLWAAPIHAGGEHLGTLLLSPNDTFTELDDRPLRLITQAAAMMLLLDNKSATAEASTRSDLLDDLLATPPRPPQQLAKHARRLGVDLSTEHLVVIARMEGTARGKGAVWASSYARQLGGLSTTRNGSSVLLLPGKDPGAAARAVSGKLSALLEQPATVSGAGPVSGPGAVRHGFLEASRCLDAMTLIGATGRAASVAELGFLGVLLSDTPDLDGFIEAAIGPVLDYDRRRSAELVRTLDAYFETGGSPTYSAEQLHVHPNTVARRLERVGELLGPDWQQSERSLDIQLALRLFRLRSVF